MDSAGLKEAPIQSKFVRGGRGARSRGRGKKRAHGFNRGKFVKQTNEVPQIQPIFSELEEQRIMQLKEDAMHASKAKRETLNRTSSWLFSQAGDQEDKVLSLFMVSEDLNT